MGRRYFCGNPYYYDVGRVVDIMIRKIIDRAKAAVFLAAVIAVVFMVCASYSVPVNAAAAESSQKKLCD